MKIILHGATNGANFGDVLFAKIFYDTLSKEGCDVFFWQFSKFGIGEFTRKHLGYDKKMKISDVLNADLLIYISGGYFSGNFSFFKRIKHYIRYFLVGEVFIHLKKKIAIIDVGGGPFDKHFLSKRIIKIVNKSHPIIVRDEETKEYIASAGGDISNLIVLTDLAQILYDFDYSGYLANNIKVFMESGKTIFLHMGGSHDVLIKSLSLTIPAINVFLQKHDGYSVIIGNDNNLSHEWSEKAFENLQTERKLIYKYNNPNELCAVLQNSDVVVTPKLHVGIIGSMFGKSVISIPYREKTLRYYKQIGESGRCILFKDITKIEDISTILETYYNKPIILSDDIHSKANEAFETLKSLTK